MTKLELKKGEHLKFYNLDFEIDVSLGSGSFGEVHKIKMNNVEYAMKSILFHDYYNFATQPGYRGLINESKIYLRMNRHDNVALFLCFYKSKGGDIYAIFELLKDGSLCDLIDELGIPSLKKLLDIAIDIANCLHHIHSYKIHHWDLNPKNILLEKHPQPDDEDRYIAKISDFGLSRIISQEGSHFIYDLRDPTSTATASDFVGNRRYVSPEQIKKEQRVDKDTDIFAFGMTLCEMLTGDTPFEPEKMMDEDSYDQSCLYLRQKFIKFLKKFGRDKIDTVIVDLILKCLHYNPQNRWKDEKNTGKFEYFKSISDELTNIRESKFGSRKPIRLTLENEYIFHQLRGIGSLALEDYESAIQSLKLSNDIENNNKNTICNLGLAQMYAGEHDLSLRNLDDALGLDPNDDEIYVYIGNVFSYKGLRLEDILNCYDKALDLNPNNFDAHYNKGFVLFSHKKIENAVTSLTEARNLDNHDPLTQLYLGLSFLLLSDQQRAEASFENVLNITQFSKEWYKKIVEGLENIRQIELVCKYCRQAQEKYPFDIELRSLCQSVGKRA